MRPGVTINGADWLRKQVMETYDSARREKIKPTLKFCNADLQVVQVDLCCKEIQGAHTGQNLAGYLMEEIEFYEIHRFVGYTTSDNATNKDTLLHHLAVLLNENDDPAKVNTCFHEHNNCLHCGQHSFHLSATGAIAVVKGMLQYLGDSPDAQLLESLWETELSKAMPNVVIKARKFTYTLGASPPRWAMLKCACAIHSIR
ncbi:hypothetical protein HDU93_000637 [Gonapodya sp. JEL0774]|nr:hypothetical protein HDU93_000637 [Gonapodya sp. JEL0774]